LSRTIKIAPSILAADFTRLGEQVREAEAAGTDVIHIDVMDGRFVPNITMGAFVVAAVRRVTKLPLDVHLMIVEPEQHLEAFASAGASSINVHLEACPNLHRTLQVIAELKCRVGVAINPHSPASLLSEVIHMLDIVLVMTVNPGFGGQTFLPETLTKIAQLRQMATAIGRPIDIGVDGGINPHTAVKVVEAGANVLIAGSDIFNERHSVQTGVDALRGAVANLSEL
jgi:ribulose-phosphate 3-epimerase